MKLAKDVANAGSQDVVGWREALAKLTGEPVKTNQDLAGQLDVGGEKKEEKKVPGDGNQVAVQG